MAIKRSLLFILAGVFLFGHFLYSDIGTPAGERFDFANYQKYFYGDYNLDVFLDSRTMKKEYLPDGTTSYYLDMNLIPGNTYYYWYKAEYSTGVVEQRTPPYHTICIISTSPAYVIFDGVAYTTSPLVQSVTTVWNNWGGEPLAPENLSGLAVPTDSPTVCNINLSWERPKFGSFDLLDYAGVEIYRSTENVTFSTNTWQFVFLSNMIETGFTDNGLPVGTTIYYAFRSYDSYLPPLYSSPKVISVDTSKVFQPVKIKFVLDMYGQDDVKNVYLAGDFTNPPWLPSLLPLEKTSPNRWEITVYDPTNNKLLVGRKINYRYLKNNDVWEEKIPPELGGPNRQLFLGSKEIVQNDVWSVPASTISVNLPEGIVSFSGFYRNSGVELFWKVDPTSLVNVVGFFLERSSFSAVDGFTGLSTMLAPDTFYYLDTTASGATFYYRLAEKLISGTTVYSDAILVSPNSWGSLPRYTLLPLNLSDFNYVPGPDTGQITVYFRVEAEEPVYEYILSYATYPVRTLADWYQTNCAGKFRAHLKGIEEYFTTVSVGDKCPGYYFNVSAKFSKGNFLGLSENILAVAPQKIDSRKLEVVQKGNISLGNHLDNYPLTVSIPAKTLPAQNYLVVIKNGRELLLDTSSYQKFLDAFGKNDRRIKYLTDIENSSIVPFYRIEIFGVDGKNYFADGRKLNRDLEISVPYGYLDKNSDGIIDSGNEDIPVEKLQIAVFNEVGNFWRLLKDVKLTVNRQTQRISFPINHLSIFGLFGPPEPAKDLSNVAIFPNPFKPTDGILENGEYNAGPDYEYIHLINLTATSEIYIYNIAGELVRHDLKIDMDGEARWDGKNDDGNYCASGLYVILIKDEKITSGKNKFLGKVAIIR